MHFDIDEYLARSRLDCPQRRIHLGPPEPVTVSLAGVLTSKPIDILGPAHIYVHFTALP